jgi:hypothetical protein
MLEVSLFYDIAIATAKASPEPRSKANVRALPAVLSLVGMGRGKE